MCTINIIVTLHHIIYIYSDHSPLTLKLKLPLGTRVMSSEFELPSTQWNKPLSPRVRLYPAICELSARHTQESKSCPLVEFTQHVAASTSACGNAIRRATVMAGKTSRRARRQDRRPSSFPFRWSSSAMLDYVWPIMG